METPKLRQEITGGGEDPEPETAKIVSMEESRFRANVLRFVQKLTSDQALQDDLMQEACIHLWQMKDLTPGQTAHWYQEGCQRYLIDHLRHGRSVDAWKRHDRAMDIEAAIEGENVALELLVSEESIISEICRRDLIAELNQWLSPTEKEVLVKLAEGATVEEIGLALGIPHQAVSKHRLQIAAAAERLGMLSHPLLAKRRRT